MPAYKQINPETLMGCKFSEELIHHLKQAEVRIQEHHGRFGHRVKRAAAEVTVKVRIGYENQKDSEYPIWFVDTDFADKTPKAPKVLRQAFQKEGGGLMVDTSAPSDPPPAQGVFPGFLSLVEDQAVDTETGATLSKKAPGWPNEGRSAQTLP